MLCIKYILLYYMNLVNKENKGWEALIINQLTMNIDHNKQHITKITDKHNKPYEQNRWVLNFLKKLPSLALLTINNETLFNYTTITLHKVFHGEGSQLVTLKES